MHQNDDKVYAPQTKILEVRTNISECVFEALLKGLSTLFRLRIVEKCFENAFGTVWRTKKSHFQPSERKHE
jgi:hypothetical protein